MFIPCICVHCAYQQHRNVAQYVCTVHISSTGMWPSMCVHCAYQQHRNVAQYVCALCISAAREYGPVNVCTVHIGSTGMWPCMCALCISTARECGPCSICMCALCISAARECSPTKQKYDNSTPYRGRRPCSQSLIRNQQMQHKMNTIDRRKKI